MIATSAWFIAFGASYSPLSPSGFVGPASRADDAALSTSMTQPWRMVGGPGAEFHVLFGVDNNGSFAVHIDKVIFGPDPAQVAAQWSPFRFQPGGDVSGEALPLRNFGATIPAHGRIRVVITLRQPNCANGAWAGWSFRAITVKWSALLHTHTTTLTVADEAAITNTSTTSDGPYGPGGGYLQYCPPA